MSGVISKPSSMGLTDFTPGIERIWPTICSSSVDRLRSATLACMSEICPGSLLPDSELSCSMTPCDMPPNITRVATPMPMPVAEMSVRMRRRQRLRKGSPEPGSRLKNAWPAAGRSAAPPS